MSNGPFPSSDPMWLARSRAAGIAYSNEFGPRPSSANGRFSAATVTVATVNTPTSATEYADAPERRASWRPSDATIAKKRNAPSGHSQRNVCGVTLPKTVTGPRPAVTNPIASATVAVARAHADTRSWRRRAFHPHHASTAAKMPRERMALASEGACQPEMKVSFIDGRNHHGGSETT